MVRVIQFFVVGSSAPVRSAHKADGDQSKRA